MVDPILVSHAFCYLAVMLWSLIKANWQENLLGTISIA